LVPPGPRGLPLPERSAAEWVQDELGARAGRAVQDQDGVRDLFFLVPPRLADGPVMNLQVEGLAGGEPEVLEDNIGLDRLGIVGRGGGAGEQGDRNTERGGDGGTPVSGGSGRFTRGAAWGRAREQRGE